MCIYLIVFVYFKFGCVFYIAFTYLIEQAKSVVNERIFYLEIYCETSVIDNCMMIM